MPFGPAEAPTAALEADLADVFAAETARRPGRFDPLVAYDGSRRQYRSTAFLEHLAAFPGDVVLGVTALDLFVPILTFVFGEALLGGRTAVVSTHRLDPERYGLPRDETLLADRLLKEAVHEIGHCLGLVHCPAQRCVMASSAIAEEIDLKGDVFCPRCRARAETARAAAPWADGA